MKCEHCFYWRSLNRQDDLTYAEMVRLSEQLGPMENLNLSGGEPFLRAELGAICRRFIRSNGVKEIYIPSNGYYTEKTILPLKEVLREPGLRLLCVELSLDGMPEFHDRFRGTRNAFRRAMETYDALAELQKQDPRVLIHAVSTATGTNMDEIRRLTTYLFDRCPRMGHHNLALIRGDWRNPSLQGPALTEYEELARYVRRQWAPREKGRYGGVVEPMLQWAKVKIAREQRQVVPCRAGVLSAVIYANGDVALCESLPPLGNLRDQTFGEIWRSSAARGLRWSIATRQCHCTNEIFLWPSLVFQPRQLIRALVHARPWRRPRPLRDEERADYRTSCAGHEPADPGRSAEDRSSAHRPPTLCQECPSGGGSSSDS
jgi:MoaA/NifB/PqqE/SkfB family radical SAM enzyme